MKKLYEQIKKATVKTLKTTVKIVLVASMSYNMGCSQKEIPKKYNPGFVRETQTIENITRRSRIAPKIIDMLDYDGSPGVDKVIISELFPEGKYIDENGKEKIHWIRKPTKYFVSKSMNEFEEIYSKFNKKEFGRKGIPNNIPYYNKGYKESALQDIRELKDDSFFEEFTEKYNTQRNLENKLK